MISLCKSIINEKKAVHCFDTALTHSPPLPPRRDPNLTAGGSSDFVSKLQRDLWQELLTWDARSKLIRELRQQVIVYPVLHRAQDDDGPRVMNYRENTAIKLRIRRLNKQC